MPMGPIALLDFVGLDVSQAIGETIGVAVPERLRELVDAGALGRKSGRGFYTYDVIRTGGHELTEAHGFVKVTLRSGAHPIVARRTS